MRREIALILCLSMMLLMPFCATRTASDTQHRNRQEELGVRRESNTACLSNNVVSGLLQKLSAGNQSDADEARKTLLDYSSKSSQCRKEVIDSIIGAMDKPNLDFEREPAMYPLWREGAILLGDLKATEALDLLITHMDLSNGEFSSTMSQQPALAGVIRMGQIAIPKLDAVLRNSPSRSMRMYSVYCMSLIGGINSKRALTQALRSELEPCVYRFILISINSFDEKNCVTPTGEWFSAFLCNN